MRGLVTFLALVVATPIAAQDSAKSDVVVRQSVDPASGAVVGQHVALYVDVLFRGAMPRPPRVSLPDVAGIQTFRFETQGTTMRESIGGEPYVGQRFEFALYARRGGGFDIPAAMVTLIDRQGDPAGDAEGEKVRLDVSVPAGVNASQPVVATRRLTLDEQWTPPPTDEFKAGDAIVRIITRAADDVPGLAMRDLEFAASEGARVYLDPPDIRDSINRGVVTGQRTDHVTYVFERGGRFVLPAVAQPWWDLSSGTLKTAAAAAVTIDIAAAPATAPTQTTRQMIGGGLILLSSAAVLIATLMFVALYAAGRRRARHANANNEREAFDAVRRACATADADSVYRALSRWRFFLAPAKLGATIEAAARLDAALFAAHPSVWQTKDSVALITRLEAIRRSPVSIQPPSVLPPLNPIGG